MSSHLRLIKGFMVGSIALFFSLVAFNNIIDFNSNFLFVRHVLSMDTTFHEPALMPRSITNPLYWHYAYYLIIGWELLTALLCCCGCIKLLLSIKKPVQQFNKSKLMAFWGLFSGFMLYMVGFIVVGGEWFSMWQSPTWNGQMKAGLFVSLIMFVMIFIQNEDKEY
jgi:predicted small integral membrane protein